MTVYLRFDSEAQARAVLIDFQFEGEWLTASHTHALDPVGELWTREEIPVKKAGWHVNFIGELPAEAVPFVISPTSPDRIFL